jgi:hypothetical protein
VLDVAEAALVIERLTAVVRRFLARA